MISRQKLSNALRILSIDAIEESQSGHPGAPLGMADIAEVLWRNFLKHNPLNPQWWNRDRFILSNGHASALLYSLLHLTGYSISLQDLKNFRKYLSNTPGHPEVNRTPGVEISTGPLGQGLASGVGMAISEHILSAYFNRKNFLIVDHYTWVFAGDGCLMEGISHEACSLAGTLGLGKLIVFYDDNGISIDGKVVEWFSDNTKKRFLAYNWQVLTVNGHDFQEILHAINLSKNNLSQPSLIICKTIIGFGSPNKSNRSISHGSPLGSKESKLTRLSLKWSDKTPFFIPSEIYKLWDFKIQGQKLENQWNVLFQKYTQKYPTLSKEYVRRMSRQLPEIFHKSVKNFLLTAQKFPENISTRQASQKTLEIFGAILPELLGGSADLAPSNLTLWSGSRSITKDSSGNYIHYGVREFGMTAIANGIFHHGGFIPYTATFLVFSDYARNAIRMAALMHTHQIFIYTHDSIGLGEDGPTHQPIEQLSTLRYIPNLSVWRPCDTIETISSWYYAVQNQTGPTALILSRQNVYQISRSTKQIENILHGGYILKEYGQTVDIIVISTGSEIKIALQVSKILHLKHGYGIRIVSMISSDVFDQQNQKYRDSILPPKILKRISIEAGSSEYWYKYTGLEGIRIGIDSFGESASGEKLFEMFGFTVKKILKRIQKFLKK
ncbi:Transketolase 2 [Buchnera aphidicola (Tuberolachnus salignus)]|uniref:Transketolase n=1 Tax=Buchnera aphidicola subsp. Tuberolachnus salignus TaxID=98804 RepID=A0A160SX46_BUCTT|nr:transketolase [Buchnera aphidicola]CUR53045.1 Transketolase 2 [Buchnera aphidicola (Tuberolachnus salignus)]